MEALIIEGTEVTPHILLDPANNQFEISGSSFPEDPVEFFEPVLNWLDEYVQNPNHKTVLDFKLKYFNTSTSGLIMVMLTKLGKIINDGKEVLVRWYYEKRDEAMLEGGEYYKDLTNVPIELIEF